MTQVDRILFSTDREIKNLKASEKRYTAKESVASGLFLDITMTGVKCWWYRYSLNGKQERLVLGRYPDLSLKDARQLRDESAPLVEFKSRSSNRLAKSSVDSEPKVLCSMAFKFAEKSSRINSP